MRTALVRRLIGASLFSLCLAGAAAAQTAGPGGRTIYDIAYYRSFSPGSALDIVQRTPGFTLNVGTPSVQNFTLELGTTQETVNVEAAAVAVNTSNATLGNRMAVARMLSG